MTIDAFKIRLAQHLKMDLELVVNENRSTMLNLLEKNRTFVRLSIHKMFLKAPDPVVSAIAHYVRGTRKENSILRLYIQEHLAQYDYTYLVNQNQLLHAGNNYNLKLLYDEINIKYFDCKLDLSITWYGKQKKSRNSTRITFGQYLAGLRLIKIHRILDDSFFPEYFVSFVIYHEMLHSVISGSLDARGRYCFHSAAFKRREKAFEHYWKAIEWEKNNKKQLFQWYEPVSLFYTQTT